ncbi:hypothetical protein DM860_001304 [Cuscuta australis]|uniref:Uncharacterized protein n=1 Tax=Cuscuta australis TaxID=267555 RepID=A0A328DTI6_9ASTE|nr:hypothetical protein DM860_001304 [Cuscuta australis]
MNSSAFRSTSLPSSMSSLKYERPDFPPSSELVSDSFHTLAESSLDSKMSLFPFPPPAKSGGGTGRASSTPLLLGVVINIDDDDDVSRGLIKLLLLEEALGFDFDSSTTFLVVVINDDDNVSKGSIRLLLLDEKLAFEFDSSSKRGLIVLTDLPLGTPLGPDVLPCEYKDWIFLSMSGEEEDDEEEESSGGHLVVAEEMVTFASSSG